METIRANHKQLVAQLGDVYHRRVVKIVEGRVFTGIVGPRGMGKTTFLLDLIRQQYGVDDAKALYVSADDMYFTNNTLVDLARQFCNEDGGGLLCIDEIHRYSNWAQELKNIYDSFPRLRVLFSGSSSINIIEQKYDLSRRALLRTMPGFSFREWLESTHHASYPQLTLATLCEKNSGVPSEITQIPGIIGLFKQYLKEGYYPARATVTETRDFYALIIAAIDKIIYQDIASYYSLRTQTLSIFKKILYFVATIPPGKINTHAIAHSLGRHHQDVGGYLDMMQSASLLRYLIIDKYGHALIRNAEKVYLDNTNLAYAIAHSIGKQANQGTIRELFVLNQLQNAGYTVSYTQSGDMTCEDYVFEIGGKSKTNKQLKNQKNASILADDIVYKSGNTIPLYLLGFLY